ncbi:MAG: hypothetical protein ACI9AF_001331 [Granulosicoccus sp.]
MNSQNAIRLLTFSGLVSTLASAAPILNEVVAKNLSHPDAAGEYPDWIEIHNPDDSAFNLKDYHLSDDETNPTKWQFPEDLIVPANGYLIVFASGEDGMTAGQAHTSFKLSSNQGETLTITAPDGESVVSSFPDGFPPLQDGQPFGRTQTENPPTFSLLETPTPGASNSIPIRIATIESFSGSTEEIDLGENITLSWSGADANRMTIYSAHGSPPEVAFTYRLHAGDGAGTIEFNPKTTTTYEFRAENNWSTAITQVTVRVKPSFRTLEFKPQRIVQGGKTIIWLDSWNEHFGSSVNLNLNDGFGDRSQFPLLYTPFNETLIPLQSTWRTTHSQEDQAWLVHPFDDNSWNEIKLPQSSNNQPPLRITFEVSNPDELLSCTIRTRFHASEIFLNGHLIKNNTINYDRARESHEIEIPLSYFESGPNVLATTINGRADDLALTAWRFTPDVSEHKINLTLSNPEGKISEEFSIDLINPALAGKAAHLVINEAHYEFSGEQLLPDQQYVEILNHGDTPQDLSGFQVLGRAIADLGRDNLNALPAGGFGVIGYYHREDLMGRWSQNLPIVAIFSQPYSANFGLTDNFLSLLDPFGRTIDQMEPPSSYRYFGPNVQRLSPFLPFSDDNTISSTESRVNGTPGTENFYVISATITPKYAEPGDSLTFRWEFSRDISFLFKPNYSSPPLLLQGRTGEAQLSMPLDQEFSPRWYLEFQEKFSNFKSNARGGALLPKVRNFSSDRRVYAPGEEVSLNWRKNGHLSLERIHVNGEVLSPNANRSVCHTPENVSSGDRLNYNLVLSEYAVDGEEFVTTPITVLFEAGDFSYPTWRQSQNLPNLDSGDFDGDALTDLMEYSLGTNPRRPNSVPLEITWNQEGHLIFSFPHNLLAPDTEIMIETSHDQITWNTYHKDLFFLSSLAPDDSHIATDRYQILGQLAQNCHFFRLRIKQAERADAE